MNRFFKGNLIQYNCKGGDSMKVIFIKDLKNSDYATKLSYKDSWNDIIDASQGIEKSTNFNLFFTQKDA